MFAIKIALAITDSATAHRSKRGVARIIHCGRSQKNACARRKI